MVLLVACALLWLSRPACADDKFWISLRTGPAKTTSCEACALKAVKYLAEKEKFLFVELDDKGAVQGWSEKSTALVMTITTPGGPMFLVLTAGPDNAENERLKDAVSAQLLTAPEDPKTPHKIGKPESRQRVKLPVIRWQSETRPMVSTLKFFGPAAGITMEKLGVNVTKLENNGVVGEGQGALLVSMACAGENGLTARITVFATGWDEENVTRLGKSYLQKLLKLLYE
jgi:hypothetical protein